MRRSIVLTAVVLLLLGALPPAASPDPAAGPASTGAVGARFGVASSHIKLWQAAGVEAELDAAAGAGMSWLRCDFAWSDLEPEPGRWDFTGADRVVEGARARGISVLGILGASPPWANGGHEWNWPPTDASAWRKYVSKVATRYAGRVAAWEIWNEQNIDQFWRPAPDAAAYVGLLEEASREIRAADPRATVVMGGVAGLGKQDLEAYLSAGAADYIDALAYHPYVETIGEKGQPSGDLLRPKERLCRELLAGVRDLISRHTARRLGVWITEVGWTSSPESPAGVDEATQADYLLRTMINYAATDVDRVIWHNLRDTHLNPWDRYGLLNLAFAPKPAYGFYSTFQEVFGACSGPVPGAASFSCAAPASLEAHAFRLPSGGLVLAAWKSDDAGDVLDIRVPDPTLADPVRIDPASGAASSLRGVSRDAAGNITAAGLSVGRTPLILKLERKPSGPRTLYFAEGYTGEGFQEYLCLANLGAGDAEVEIAFLFPGGERQDARLRVPGGSRCTVDVNAAVGAGREVAMAVSSSRAIAAERPMYFSYGAGWTGGHVAAGTEAPSRAHYFAEGYTGEGFEQWFCLLNPGDEAADITFRFQTEEEGQIVRSGLSVGPHSRASFKVNDLLGGGYQASCVVESTHPVVAERPMYFEYRGRGAHGWRGGHCVAGAGRPATAFYFAEGTTRVGFEEWLTLQNPGPRPLQVEAVYHFGPGQGGPLTRRYSVEGNGRLTVFVPDEVGAERDVSVALTSASPFLAERPMYFAYAGMGAAGWRGGHCSIGAEGASRELIFAEGYTGDGFHTWLCLQNPGGEDALVEVDYLTMEAGALPPRTVVVPPGTRISLFVGEHAGAGYQVSTILRVLSGPPLVAERPMYFSRGGRDGGHDAVGFDPD